MTAISPDQEASLHTAQQIRQVHTITDRFGMVNSYLIADGHPNGKLVVVDPRSTLNARLVLSYIQRFLERSPTDIDLIVLTHLETHHGGGIEVLQRHCQAPVAALGSGQVAERSADEPTTGRNRATMMQLRASGRLPLEFFSSAYSHQLKQIGLWLRDVSGLPGHEDWRVISSGNQTRGHLCLYNPFSRELIGGATISTNEGGTPVLHAGGSRRTIQETLQVLRSLNVSYLYPGYGKPLLARNAIARIESEW
jgi:hydroxyacylglutathione hydrolase